MQAPFSYEGVVLGSVQATQQGLGCRNNTDLLGMGARSFYDWSFGSSMNLPIRGQKPCEQCEADTTGSKRFRPAYYNNELQSCGQCSVIDPTNPCVYFSKEFQSDCSFGWQRNLNNYRSPHDGNKFAQYRWG